MPKRIQRQRTKGWRMPEGAVYVGRPTCWGNPFWDVKRYGVDLCLKMFANSARGMWIPTDVPASPHPWTEWLYRDHCEWLAALKRAGWIKTHPTDAIRRALRGKDLACWCPLDQPCHADVLLELANAEV